MGSTGNTGSMATPVSIEGVDIWGDARDDATPDATPIVMAPAIPHARETQSEATRRWRISGISEQVAAFRDRVRADYLIDHPGCKRRDAHNHAWARAMAEFPPPGIDPPAAEVVADPPAVDSAPAVQDQPQPDPPAAADQAAASSPPASATPPAAAGGVQGLGDLPPSWPALPPNASLAAEVAWVHANRIRVRQGEGVDLSRAISPAPSYAALSWLETSILYPSKWADVTVKASAEQADAAEDIRRERLALADLQALLAEAASAIP